MPTFIFLFAVVTGAQKLPQSIQHLPRTETVQSFHKYLCICHMISNPYPSQTVFEPDKSNVESLMKPFRSTLYLVYRRGGGGFSSCTEAWITASYSRVNHFSEFSAIISVPSMTEGIQSMQMFNTWPVPQLPEKEYINEALFGNCLFGSNWFLKPYSLYLASVSTVTWILQNPSNNLSWDYTRVLIPVTELGGLLLFIYILLLFCGLFWK